MLRLQLCLLMSYRLRELPLPTVSVSPLEMTASQSQPLTLKQSASVDIDGSSIGVNNIAFLSISDVKLPVGVTVAALLALPPYESGTEPELE